MIITERQSRTDKVTRILMFYHQLLNGQYANECITRQLETSRDTKNEIETIISRLCDKFKMLKSKCDIRLREIYPQGIPDFVEQRYQRELHFLKNTDYIDSFVTHMLVSEGARHRNISLMIKGALANSIIVYLLGNSIINPLPAHYYCKQCGNFEVTNESVFGIYLPSKNCPRCGSTYTADGFSLKPELAWGINGEKAIFFEYKVVMRDVPVVIENSSNFLEKTRKYAMKCNSYYGEDNLTSDKREELIKDYFSTSAFEIYPCYTSDDLYKQILSVGVEQEKALHYVDIIRKGKHNFNLKEYKEKFEAFDIPEQLKEVARMYNYLTPLAYVIQKIMYEDYKD